MRPNATKLMGWATVLSLFPDIWIQDGLRLGHRMEKVVEAFKLGPGTQ